MIDTITRFFNKHLNPANIDSETSRTHTLQLATAALLFETTRVDENVDDVERQAVNDAITKQFDLSDEETRELIELASEEARQATCYYEFTSLINREFSQDQKIALIEMMWQIVFADNIVHMHEDHLVRKISELLYVSHKDFIAAKLRVQQRTAQNSG